MRFPHALLATVVLVLGSCTSEPPTPPSRSSPSPTGSASPAQPSPSAEPSVDPGPVPEGIPTDYGPAVDAQDVPPEALIPSGAIPTGEWFAFTDAGVMILIAWAEGGDDFTALPRGVALWRPAPSAPHWRLASVRTHRANEGLTEIQVTAADVTGDGSDDAIVFEGTGGTGGCGSWFVLELLSVERIFRKELCDGRLEPGPPDAPGLVLTESVYHQGDAHCCPSALRRTTLAWSGSTWRVTDRTETAA
jgi:hypothetical protein